MAHGQLRLRALGVLRQCGERERGGDGLGEGAKVGKSVGGHWEGKDARRELVWWISWLVWGGWVGLLVSHLVGVSNYVAQTFSGIQGWSVFAGEIPVTAL